MFDDSRPLAIAHRGIHDAHRENTLPAVRAAMAAGADAVEIDVQLAGDGTVVVNHDESFGRLWGDPRPVAAMTWPEIAELGEGDTRVARLEDLLEASAEFSVPLVVEVKNPLVALPALDVVRASRAGLDGTAFCGPLEGVMVVRDAAMFAQVFYNDVSTTLPDIRLLTALRPNYYNPIHYLLSPATVLAFHAFGFKVSCWTPDTQAEQRLLLDMGVDAIMTDRLDVLQGLLAERAR